jgi:hypothetical protein
LRAQQGLLVGVLLADPLVNLSGGHDFKVVDVRNPQYVPFANRPLLRPCFP